MNKTYVLDTSVLIHDPNAFTRFEDNTVAIPIFVVMELDVLKSSRRYEVAASARMASRFISGLLEHGGPRDEEGVKHPDYDSVFRVIANGGGQGLNAFEEAENSSHMDRLILSSALTYSKANPDQKVVMVSKDVNMRILALYEGLCAEDYESDRVNFNKHYRGYREVHEFDENLILKGYQSDKNLFARDMELSDLYDNEFVLFHARGTVQPFRYFAHSDILDPVFKEFPATKVTPRNVEQRMALDLLMDPDVSLVTLIGKSGTGKTFLALASALAQIDSRYDKILLSKPVVAMGKDVGYLPGDFEAKMQPWMMSFFDNLDQLFPSTSDRGMPRAEKAWEHLVHSDALEVQAIHSIRGRSIPNSFMLIDEVQNLTPHECKSIITRASEGTKVVLCGDPYQIDHQFLDRHSNGLVYVTERMKESSITGTVYFTQGERSELAELAATCL